jgi:hypothetical protein
MPFMAQKTGAYANLSEGIFWMTIRFKRKPTEQKEPKQTQRI